MTSLIRPTLVGFGDNHERDTLSCFAVSILVHEGCRESVRFPIFLTRLASGGRAGRHPRCKGTTGAARENSWEKNGSLIVDAES